MTELSKNQFVAAGWLAIISAVLLVPEISLAALAEFYSSTLTIFVIPIHIANLIIGIYLLYMFRKLLNDQFNFHSIDVIITILIIVNIISFFVGLVELTMSLIGTGKIIQDSMSIVTVILFIPYCILTIVFGVKLLNLKEDLYGMQKPFAYTTIASGVCGATLILAPLGLITAVVALVMQGMIFLRVQRESEIL